MWAGGDRRDERGQVIIDDCRAIDDLKLLLVQLPSDQANDIAVQHKLRECLTQYRPESDELGVKVPVVAEVCLGDSVRYVRLGAQFCVRDPVAAVQALNDQSFTARCSDRLVLG